MDDDTELMPEIIDMKTVLFALHEVQLHNNPVTHSRLPREETERRRMRRGHRHIIHGLLPKETMNKG